MKIQHTEIAGQPIGKVRDLLREMSRLETMSRAGIIRNIGTDITDALVAAKLIEESPELHGQDGSPRYRPSANGGAGGLRLANAKLLKRIDRAKADDIVYEMLGRADAINADDDLLYRVARIDAFGSYITDASDLGDIDVVVTFEFKKNKGEKVKANQARARASGRKVGFIEGLVFGESEVRNRLKGRNRYLSLMDADDTARLGVATMELYPNRPPHLRNRTVPPKQPKPQRTFTRAYQVTYLVSTKASGKAEADRKIDDAFAGKVVRGELKGGMLPQVMEAAGVTAINQGHAAGHVFALSEAAAANALAENLAVDIWEIDSVLAKASKAPGAIIRPLPASDPRNPEHPVNRPALKELAKALGRSLARREFAKAKAAASRAHRPVVESAPKPPGKPPGKTRRVKETRAPRA